MVTEEQIRLIQSLTLAELSELLEVLRNEGRHDQTDHVIWARCATDLELFSSHFFPHYCTLPFNEFHRDDFESIQYGERSVRRARGAPRGYAKSTLKALIKPIHDLCYGLEKFIVIFSNTESQATAKLKDIRSELLTNTALINAYGIFFRKRQIAETAFEVFSNAGSIYYSAYSAGTEVRGIRYGAYRPSKLILDDVEHSEEVYNEAIRDKYFSWLTDVVSKLGDGQTNIEFIGTVLHKDSLLMRTLKNPMYQSKLYRAVISWSDQEQLWETWRGILRNLDNDNRLTESNTFFEENKELMLSNTKVLWPEKESYLYLMQEMLETGKRSFMKEKQNEPMGPDDKIFESIYWYKETEQNGQPGLLVEHSNVFIPMDHLRAYAALDPSTGQTKAKKGKQGDFSCLVTGMSDSRGRLFVHRDWTKRVAPSKFIDAIFDNHDLWKYEKVGVETNLFRELLLDNIRAERTRREAKLNRKLHIAFYDIENHENKEKRIFSLEPKVSNGWILFNRALSQEFMNQVDDFPHGDHDDCPDALEMLWRLINNRFTMNAIDLNPMAGR